MRGGRLPGAATELVALVVAGLAWPWLAVSYAAWRLGKQLNRHASASDPGKRSDGHG